MEKKGNSKLVWYVLFVFMTVILCYLFTVVYFYFISPYNISLKLAFWPFNSEEQVADMYCEATVEIEFDVTNEEFVEEKKTVLGVNVRQDGYVVAPASDFLNVKDDTSIKIYSVSGKVFLGKLLFLDERFDLAILKCESVDKNDDVKLPFVKIGSLSNVEKDLEIISVSTPVSDKKLHFGAVSEINCYDYVSSSKDGQNVVESLSEFCFAVSFADENYEGGAIFDQNASLLGFTYCNYSVENWTESTVLPVEMVKIVLDDVVNAYQNEKLFSCEFVDCFCGFDIYELECYDECSKTNTGNEDEFFFNGSWHQYNDSTTAFLTSDKDGLYLMEDFAYKDATIEAGNVIIALQIDGENIEISTRYEFFWYIYQLREGDTVKIFFEPVSDTLSNNVVITL